METEQTLSLSDIPDLSTMGEDDRSPSFEDGWYTGKILAKRAFTDKMGNDRVFESDDTPAQKSGRNIRLQVELTRASDKRTINVSTLINYQPDDLTPEAIAAVVAKKEDVKTGGEWGPMFRSFMTLNRLGRLQKIAGVKSLGRNGNGGLDLSPLYGKTAYFQLVPDERNPDFKAVKNFQAEAPKKAKVL